MDREAYIALAVLEVCVEGHSSAVRNRWLHSTGRLTVLCQGSLIILNAVLADYSLTFYKRSGIPSRGWVNPALGIHQSCLKITCVTKFYVCKASFPMVGGEDTEVVLC